MNLSSKSIPMALCLLFAIMALHDHAFGQERKRIDSLNYKLRKAKSDSARVYLLVELSSEYENHDLTVSLGYAEKANLLAEKSGSGKLNSYTLFNLAYVYYSQGVFLLSIQYFSRYMEIQKEEGNIKEVAFAQVNLGAIYITLSNYTQAKKNFEEALNILEKVSVPKSKHDYTSQIITIYNNLGIVYQNLQKPDQSIDYYLRGIKLARKSTGDSSVLSKLLNNLGSLYFDEGKFANAVIPMTEALEIREKNNDQIGLAQSYRMFASYYSALKNNRKTLEFLTRGVNLAAEVGSNPLLADFAELLYTYYNDNHHSDSALKYHVLLKDLNDKMKMEESVKELTRMELTSQFKEKEKIQLLEQKRKELYYMLGGITLFLILIIVTLLYFLSQNRLRRMKLEKINADLGSKNLSLEKENLAKELEFKKKEITLNVMSLMKKNEMLSDISKKIVEFREKAIHAETNDALKHIGKELQKSTEEETLKEFSLRFMEVHKEFYDTILLKFPELTPSELKLCAFLRLNMTTKEISELTGQRLNTLENARYRLRQKLGISNSEINLVTFLSQI